MFDTVVLTRGQVWLSPEIRELVGLDAADEKAGFAVLLEEAMQPDEKEEVAPLRCA